MSTAGEIAADFRDKIYDGTNGGTADRYERSVRYWIEWCRNNDIDLDTATGDDLHDFLRDTTADGYSESEAKNRRAAVSRFYSEMGYGDESNPSDELDMKWAELGGYRKEQEWRDRDYYVSDDEFDAMIENVPAPTRRNRIILRILREAGLRAGECATLRTQDVRQTDRGYRLAIRTEKAHSTRSVPISDGLGILITQEWMGPERRSMGGFDPETDWLFPSERSARISGETINRYVVKPAAERAGIQDTLYTDKAGYERKKVTAHSLRFTAATDYADEDDVTIRDIKTFLGHESVEQTEHYLRREEERMQDAIRGVLSDE